MKALIIAAGNGTRMQPVTRGRHKSLMPLLGLKIIERVILGARSAGISEFVIVTGYRGEDLKRTLGDGTKYGVSIAYVGNDKWEKANGISVYKARKHFRENFVLLMSDHVFDPRTLEKIQRLRLKKKECVLAVDKKLDGVRDVVDTTKVLIKKARVISIGKKLGKYSAFDTGMFVCSPFIFKVLKKTIAMGKNSLTNAMSVLAAEDKLRVFNIKKKFWADCDTYADIKFAEKKLLTSLIKSKDGFISKNFNRKISALITKLLVKTPLTPNAISFSLPILAIFTFFLLAEGTYPWIFLGGMMIQLLSIVDGCDGEIARLKFIKSKWGAWLDPILDRYIDTLFIAGMSYGYWRITGNGIILPIAIFVMLAMMMEDYMPNKFLVEVGKKLKFQSIEFKRDLRSVVLALGAITNLIIPALLIFLIISQFRVIGRLLAGKKISEEETRKTPVASALPQILDK